MFLAMPSEPEEPYTSALNPTFPTSADRHFHFFSSRQLTFYLTTSLCSHPCCTGSTALFSSLPPTNYSISPAGSFFLSGAWLQQPPGSGTHLYPSSHTLMCYYGTQP